METSEDAPGGTDEPSLQTKKLQGNICYVADFIYLTTPAGSLAKDVAASKPVRKSARRSLQPTTALPSTKNQSANEKRATGEKGYKAIGYS
jgi:hypothetical protein